MLWANAVYLIAIAGAPILMGFSWWGWFRDLTIQLPKWRAMLFLSGLCAGTANCMLLWSWAVWLHFHYNPTSWRAQDIVSAVGLYLVLYSIIVAIAGRGIYRLLLGISGVLALLPWIPVGVL